VWGGMEDWKLKHKPFIIVMYAVCAAFLVFGYILLCKDGWVRVEDFLKPFFNEPPRSKTAGYPWGYGQ